jgi:hypothetical protein
MKIYEILAETTAPVIHDRQVTNILKRGGHTHTITPLPKTNWDQRDRHALALHPIGGQPYHRSDAHARQGRTPNYYNPEIADLQTIDPGVEYLEHNRAVLKPEHQHREEIEPLGPGFIYRGMSAEEYQFLQQTGRIESTGNYNIGTAQAGLTYWTTDVRTAESYANGFAPIEHKPSFKHPAYIVAARMPAETRHVQGTGAHEVGVARPILTDEIVAIWEGTVYDYSPIERDMIRDDDGSFRSSGSGSGPNAQLAWTRIK